ncbi:MAG: GatB/YqeY domain-containing protein [Candidatus Kerfeldbacteria bacterium]|nr:GatB/YqeY domain-containing protein [Candidatus Kerfeldbacteria bacterium]
MGMLDDIEAQYKEAFKAHHQPLVDALRLMKAAIKNEEIAVRHPLDDAQAVVVLQREAKHRREALATYAAAGRQDLAAKEQAELDIMSKFLPAALSDAALEAMVVATIADLQAGQKDFGKVMSAVMAKAQGQADGQRVSAVVKVHLH